MPRGDTSSMKDFPFPLPSLSEQQRIADCLSSLDEWIAGEGRRLDALKDHKKGLMQQLFPAEGETAPNLRVSAPPREPKSEGRHGELTRRRGDAERSKEPAASSPKRTPKLRFPEFRNAPEWEEKKLRYLLDSISNGLTLDQVDDSSGFKVTRIETISDGSINLNKVGYVASDQNISAYKLEVGDILFSNINSLAHIGKNVLIDQDYDLYHGMNLLRLVVDKDICDPRILYFLLNTSQIRESVRQRSNKAVNQASINQPEVGRTVLDLPKSLEQQRIADCLSSLDEWIAAQTDKLDALKEHKKGLMQQLFPSSEEGKP